jgi:hypothetical protein
MEAETGIISKELAIVHFVVLVRVRTIPTEGPPLVGEVSVNICG